ncbi:MAG: alpha-galactosidase [Lachnospiraceae bacterium]|nr:alpha-galactosidase [Lachnospiraceae bacterium]
MSIFFDQNRGLITLHTKTTSYQMKIDSYRHVQHLYYGASIGDADMSYLHRHYDRGFSGNPYNARCDRTYSLDTLSQEYTSFGVGDFRISSLIATIADGSSCTEFLFEDLKILPGKYALPGLPVSYDRGEEAETLILTLIDPIAKIRLALYYGVFEELDIITRAAKVFNDGAQPLTLEKASSACLDLPYDKWDLIHFHGRHCMERQFERVPLSHNIQEISSIRGISSHQHNPFVIICDHEAGEDHGACYGFMLSYSGNFSAEIEYTQLDAARVVMGIAQTHFRWELAPGECFAAPEVILSYADGLTSLSHRYHHFLRFNVCRGKHQFAKRPVLLNSWEATYFSLKEETLLALAKEAAALNIELFVLDDGWYQGRTDDNAALGDWFADKERLPHGLAALSKNVHDLGLLFGLWVEPEMVSENSDLFRTHPDWVVRVPGRNPLMSRNQMALDLSRQDVVDYLYDVLSKLFRENAIDYIKWDINRTLSDLYSNALSAKEQGKFSHLYVLGLYQLLERLTQAFPDILFEGCAGGGGRFDAGMLAYFPQIWVSDDTDAIERLIIQEGTSYGYPASVMASHVSACPNHQTGRTTPLATRGLVAKSGLLGYELNVCTLSDAEKTEIRHQIAEYHRDEIFVQEGLYYRLASPQDHVGYTAWEFALPDSSAALVNLVNVHPQANAILIHLCLKGLDPQATYRIEEDDLIVSGEALMRGGYTFPQFPDDFPAMQLHLYRVDEKK